MELAQHQQGAGIQRVERAQHQQGAGIQRVEYSQHQQTAGIQRVEYAQHQQTAGIQRVEHAQHQQTAGIQRVELAQHQQGAGIQRVESAQHQQTAGIERVEYAQHQQTAGIQRVEHAQHEQGSGIQRVEHAQHEQTAGIQRVELAQHQQTAGIQRVESAQHQQTAGIQRVESAQHQQTAGIQRVELAQHQQTAGIQRVEHAQHEQTAGIQRVEHAQYEQGAGIQRVELAQHQQGAGIQRVESAQHQQTAGIERVEYAQHQQTAGIQRVEHAQHEQGAGIWRVEHAQHQQTAGIQRVESAQHQQTAGIQRVEYAQHRQTAGIQRVEHAQHEQGAGIQRVEHTQHQQGAAIRHVKRHQIEEAQDNRRRERDNALNKLRRAPEAKLDSGVQPLDDHGKLLLCFKDTRVAIIDTITNWINDPNSPPIFWLHGLAGTGKSTIARTIGVKAEEAGYTTTSFFFSRIGSAGQRDPAYVFPTLAHQLAAGHSHLHQTIGDAVINSPDIDYAVTFKQFQTLVGAPLDAFCLESEGTGSILIVLDALDECQGIEERRPQEILACLRDHAYKAAPRIRILLTSRPEPYLRRELAPRPQVVEYNLHQDDESAQGDIARFLEARLPLIPGELGISVEGWPREEDAQLLSEKSGRLFIFAKTALRFIANDRVMDPRRQMDTLLGMGNGIINPYSPLDQLYLQVLESAFPKEHVPDDLFVRFRRVVGCIILSQDALPVSLIAKIANYSENEVMVMLLRLQSVILCSSPPGTVSQQNSDLLPHAYHPSFPDYLVDSRRCPDSNFTIIKPKMHAFIVLRCFELMKGVLCRNIIELHEIYALNQDIPDLEVKVQSHITPEAAYACQFGLLTFSSRRWMKVS